MTINEKVELWKKNVSGKEAGELEALDSVGKENAFYKDLEFGTGGLRGEIGIGSNCMNIYTVKKASQGAANYVLKCGGKAVAISRDSRNFSEDFAFAAAEVFASSGLKVFITRELMPTPFLSFITRAFKCDMGVMVTASHNPAKYNGYKVYGSDGCQVTDNAAQAIMQEIEKVDIFAVKTDSYDNLLKQGKIEIVGEKLEKDYLAKVKSRSINDVRGDLSITYTPLNGTGYRLVPIILKEIGVKNIFIVPEQSQPNGDFPTCSYPNPEKKEALKLGLEHARKNNSDLLIATDPDADRVGIAVRHNREYKLLTGNEVGLLLTDYLLSQTKVKEPIVIKTIVSSKLAEALCKKYGAQVESVLTGFKYIGEKIGKLEKAGQQERFVFGFEESYGYLSGTYVRDKDAVVGSMLIAEMAAFYKEKGKTLVDKINEIYLEFGVYQHKLLSYQFDGASGNATMARLIGAIRDNMFKAIGGYKVVDSVDYLTQTKLDLPKANVLQFDLENNNQVIVRPSGTEPLIKIYLTATINEKENEKIFQNLTKELDEFFK